MGCDLLGCDDEVTGPTPERYRAVGGGSSVLQDTAGGIVARENPRFAVIQLERKIFGFLAQAQRLIDIGGKHCRMVLAQQQPVERNSLIHRVRQMGGFAVKLTLPVIGLGVLQQCIEAELIVCLMHHATPPATAAASSASGRSVIAASFHAARHVDDLIVDSAFLTVEIPEIGLESDERGNQDRMSA
jgi:hypothetical protein